MRDKQRQSDYFKKWYKKNRTKVLEKNRAWNISHREFLKSYRKQRYVRKLPPLEIRFWNRVDKQGENECWNWKGCKYPSGYGRLGFRYAHRFSYELKYGKIIRGLHICHSCDNPSCVNPNHLWVGTVADNMHDRDRKGRDRFSKLKNLTCVS